MPSHRTESTPTHRRRHLALLATVVAALVLPSCGDDQTTLPDVVGAVIQVQVEPNPVTGVQSPLTGSVSASYKIVIDELAGLGGELVFVSSTVYDPASGQQVAINYFDSADLLVFVGTKRIEPRGQVVVPQSLSYVLPDLGKATNINVSVQVKDDRENVTTRSLLVPVQ